MIYPSPWWFLHSLDLSNKRRNETLCWLVTSKPWRGRRPKGFCQLLNSTHGWSQLYQVSSWAISHLRGRAGGWVGLPSGIKKLGGHLLNNKIRVLCPFLLNFPPSSGQCHSAKIFFQKIWYDVVISTMNEWMKEYIWGGPTHQVRNSDRVSFRVMCTHVASCRLKTHFSCLYLVRCFKKN